MRSPFFRSLVSLNNATAVTSAPEFSSWTVPMRSMTAVSSMRPEGMPLISSTGWKSAEAWPSTLS